MSDLYNEMLQKSIERQAREIASKGATVNERYGTLLDSVKDRNLEQEERDRRQEMISRIHSRTEESRVQREKESAESKRNLQRIIRDVESRDRRKANEFLTKNKAYLDKAQETIRKQQSKTYFS